MKNLITFLITSLVLIAMVMPASASPCGKWSGKGHGYGMSLSAVPDLNLTAEQKDKLTALKTAYLKDVKPLRDKAFSKRGDLRLLWREKNPDQAKILAAQKQLRNYQGQIQDRRTPYRLAVLKVLTPEQQDKIKAYKRSSVSGPEQKKFNLSQYLNLSKEQMEKVKELRSRFYTETKDLRNDMAIKRLEMKKLFTDPKTDDAILLAMQKEMSALRQQMSDKIGQMMIEGRKILTPEQLMKLDRMPMGANWLMGPGMRGRGMMGGEMMHEGMMGGEGRMRGGKTGEGMEPGR